MRTHYIVLALVLGSLLAGCGGGGGGTGSTQQPPGGMPPPSGGTPPPSGGSTGASSAQVLFPGQKAGTLRSSVVLRGTASDPDGVAAVRVNGVVATLAAVPSGGGSAKTAGSIRQALSGAELRSAHGSANVEWSVEVDLEAGENDLVVSVEDDTGEETVGADEITVKYAEVPNLFTSDAGDSRLIGWSTTITPTGLVTRLVQFDAASRELTVFPQLQDVGIASCFRSHTNELLYLTGAVDVLHRFDLTARESSPVADLSSLLSADPGFDGPFLVQVVCNGTHESAYVLANYWENGNAGKSRVLRVELSGNVSILTETDPGAPEPWFAYKIALSNDALISFREVNPVAPLTRISLEDGSRTELAPIAVGGLAIAAALEQSLVYVTTFEGVDELLLANPPSKRNISPVESTDPLTFSQASSIAIDFAMNRVVVGDSDLDVLIAVDLPTGERSELLSRKIGAGPPFISPMRLAVTADSTTAYVTDNGLNAPARLFAIDLATGDRRTVGVLPQDGISASIKGIALDEAAGYAYVSRFAGAVYQVNLASEEAQSLTLHEDGLIEQIEDVLLDAANGRLLVADSATDAIVAVDLVTLQRELISQAGTRGDGPAFDTLSSLAMGEDEMSLYATDQGTDQILRVDLETGNREVVDTSCALGATQNMNQVLYDAATRELLIASDGLFIFDLDTSVCTEVAPSWLSALLLGVQHTSDGRILAAGFNAVTEIDRHSGEVVIVSK